MGNKFNREKQEEALSGLSGFKAMRYNDLYRPMFRKNINESTKNRRNQIGTEAFVGALRQARKSDAQMRRLASNQGVEGTKAKLGSLVTKVDQLAEKDMDERQFNAVRHGLGLSSMSQQAMGQAAQMAQQNNMFMSDLRHNKQQQKLALAGDLLNSGVAQFYNPSAGGASQTGAFDSFQKY